jgi:hypothetical protein
MPASISRKAEIRPSIGDAHVTRRTSSRTGGGFVPLCGQRHGRCDFRQYGQRLGGF